MTSQPHDKRIKLSHFGNPNYSGNTVGSGIDWSRMPVAFTCSPDAFRSNTPPTTTLVYNDPSPQDLLVAPSPALE